MKSRIICKDNKVYAINENGDYLYAKNAWKLSDDAFHLNHGGYIYPEPLDLNLDYEIITEDEKTCRIVKAV